MSINNSLSAYGGITKIFHWLTALLMFTVIPLGVVANQLPFDTDAELALKAQLFSFHKTLGVILFGVALLRILWALTQQKPNDMHPERVLESGLAAVVHWLLYISLVIVPLSGWIHHAATTGFAPILMPIGQDIPFVPKDETIANVFAALHWLWSKILVGAILLHILGALKHHFIDKDATLRRMWFGATELPEFIGQTPHKRAPMIAFVIYFCVTGIAGAAGLLSHQQTSHSVATLEEVTSEWTVLSGSIDIEITQLGSAVTGNFADWTSEISLDPDVRTGTAGNVKTVIAVPSLALGSVSGQALERDFFDAATFPTAEFAGTIMVQDGAYTADGTLAIKGNAVPITFPFDLRVDDDLAEMTGQITLDRRDFQIGQSMTDEASVGFAVNVSLRVLARLTAE